jgi:6-pyruvoyltetrahydropterin/6-carboxytetrahydropterin synthase
MKIIKAFHFDSAHYLPKYNGPCNHVHGHRWKLLVEVEGYPKPESGMIMDFNHLKNIVEDKVIDLLDHQLINDFIENPTAENILLWIRDKLSIELKSDNTFLGELTLYETPDSCAILK